MLSHCLRRTRRGGYALAWVAFFGLVVGVAVRSAPAADAKPARKDSGAPRYKEATLTTAVKPAEARAGETVNYQVTVKLEPGWHIFKYGKRKIADTTFDFFDTAGLKIAGDWTPSRPPIRKNLASAGGEAEFYEGEVTWSIPLLVPPDAEPGRKTLRNQIGMRICDAKMCKIPGQWTLPDAVLNVVPGTAAASSAPPAPATDTATAATASEPPTPAANPGATAAAAGSDLAGSKRAAEAPISEVAQRARQGLWSFLLFSAGGGLLALVMPCVWPMVPITVNFFVKQGQHNKGKTTGLAIAYCLAIIGVFTAFGVLVSFFFSATALQNLATNAWLNAAVAILFLAFGLSLLGLFEIRLPNFLLNASAKGESKGGMVGVMFMALTLTITSFTCTFPVVGGLIVMAAAGEFFYPIIGLATFSAVLAFPFFLLALAPGLLSKMPRSGDWMNAVKVVGGLVEIGAALKFINTAEIGFGTPAADAWFDSHAVLAIWVVLSAVCGIYLLGLFRTDHDHDAVKVGPGRLLIGSLFLAFALFLSPALFGRPPQSRLWYTLVGIFPPDVGKLTAHSGGGGPAVAEQRATSSDPQQAEREETKFHGVSWGLSYEAAIEKAKAENRPVLIDFTGQFCANCRQMEESVMPRPEVTARLKEFVTVQLYTDILPINSITREQQEERAEKNQNRLLRLANANDNPYYIALAPDGQVLGMISGLRSPAVFVDFLNQALEKYQGARKVAQVSP